MALRPLDPSIVNFYQPPKINMPDPLQDVAALEQIKSGRVSRQLHEQQLAQLQRDSTALDKMKEVLASNGQSTDLDAASDAMIRTGIPHVMDVGFKIKQKRDFQKNFELAIGGGAAPPAQPTPVSTTAPIQGPVMSMENLSAGGTGIKMRSNLPEQASATTNALTPSGFPTNFGDNVLGQINELERQRKGLIMLAAENPQITPMVAELSRQIAKLREPQAFSPGQTVYVPGQAPFTLPSTPQRPMGLSPGEVMVDPSTGQIIAKGAAREAPASAPLQQAFDTKTNSQVFVDREAIRANPDRYKPFGAEEKLKNIPETVNKALTGNSSSISQINKAIDAATENPNAIGLKGNLPQAILNRTDPQGVDTRALITEIGSAIVHDRSGAAVAASERPTLVPFIPQTTDDSATAIKKLKQLKAKIQAEQSGILDFYSQEQGYKPSLYHKKQDVPAEPAAPAAAKPAAADIGSLPPKVTKNGKTYVLQPNGKYIEQ
jgi:hypothetical protein